MAEFILQPETIRQRLRRLSDQPVRRWQDKRDKAGLRFAQSAVLVPLCERDGALNVLFTERSMNLRNHAGEISFPGGRREDVDPTLLDTALRETHEEIGLAPQNVQVYGALASLPTYTGFEITAYVGEFEARHTLVADTGEIDQIFEAPLSALRDPACHRIENRAYHGRVYPLHFYDFEGHVIWGATGLLLYTLLEFLELPG